MTSQKLEERQPTLVNAQAVVRDFLKESLPEVYRVDVTRVMPVDSAPTAWEAMAAVWQPNGIIQSLGLSTQRPVLDRTTYVVRLDNRLNVIGYETEEEAERTS